MPVKTEDLLKRMSAYKRQYHAALSQLQESKRTNANLNDRCTKSEAKVTRLETYIERLEEDLSDIKLPPTILDDDPESDAPWVLDEEYDSDDYWRGSDFQDWNESDENSEDDGW